MRIRRLMVFTISFSSLIIFPAILAVAGNQATVHHHDVCGEEKCGPDGPIVRFPFALLGKQSESCGYNSNYTLHCDELNRTILELPSSSTKFIVTKISYSSQLMEVQSLETCFAKQLRDLDISTTPFQYDYYESFVQFSLFNCSSSGGGHGNNRLGNSYNGYIWVKIDCLSNAEYEVYATYTNSAYGDIYDIEAVLESCTKMYDTNFVPMEILNSQFININWTLPQCQRCEAGGGICRWKNSTSDEIGCHHSKSGMCFCS